MLNHTNNSLRNTGLRSNYPLIALLALLVITAFVLAACAPDDPATTSEDRQTEFAPVAQEWNEFTNELRGYSAAQRDQAAAAIRRKMNDIDRDIDQLQRQVDTSAEKASDGLQRQQRKLLAEIKEQRADLEQWADKVGDKSEDAWDDVVDGFSNAYEKLARSFAEAKQGFRS